MKICIHPLFVAVMLFSALSGGLPIALICMLTALLHECGHIFCANGMGYTCKKLVICPYGAAAYMDIEGIRPADEVKLALAGPAVNAAMCVALAGLWWFFPPAYAFTDTLMYANVAMLAVNLLPAYPLDGGRLLGCLVRALFGEKAEKWALRAMSLLVAAAFVVLFFFSGYNPSVAIFALFMLLSVFEKPVQAVRLNFSSSARLKRGIEVKYVLCDGELTFKDAIKRLDMRRFTVFQLYDGGIADEITQDELYEMSLECGIYDRVFAQRARNDAPNSEGDMSPEDIAETQSQPSDIALSITGKMGE